MGGHPRASINKGGTTKSADFVATGIRAIDVVNLWNADFLYRVRRGYYELAETNVVSEKQLIAILVSKGIVCVESALFHYGYSDFAHIAFAKKNAGIGASVVAHIKNTKTPFRIDFGVEMLSYRSRKNTKSRHSFPILTLRR